MTVHALEQLADAAALEQGPPTRRMLVVVNPYATSVSDRLKQLVVYALRGRYAVDAVDTQRPGHATELCREAAHEGYDVVVAFGGDGTVNEVANGLVGSDTVLTCLPGGAANVYCRMLGIPTDVVDAAERLLGLADAWAPRRVDLGRVDDRWFTFSAGAGLDASVVERVDRHPRLKARIGPWYYAQCAVATFLERYVVRPPGLIASASGGEEARGVSVFVQNGQPYTYFGRRPVRLSERAGLRTGALSAVVLERASPVDLPTLAVRLLSARAPVGGHRRVRAFDGLDGLRIRSADGRPVPLQVDGEYLGEVDEAAFDVRPSALRVVA